MNNFSKAVTILMATVPASILIGVGGAGADTAPTIASGCDAVHVGPVLKPGAPPSSYFNLNLKAGQSADLALIVANPEPYTCRVDVQPAYGATAINSGDTYPVTGGTPSTCARTSCWLTGLPADIAAPPDARMELRFKVSVPAGTSPGDYLAGVVAGPAGSRPALSLGHAQAGAILIARVGIGVAVTVPGAQAPLLKITNVKLTGTKAGLLSVTMLDQGNTWEHPKGEAIVEVAGKKVAFPLASATVLPGDHATLPLAVSSIRQGEWPTEVELWYDHHHRLATWLGSIGYTNVPVLSKPRLAPASRVTFKLPAWTTIALGTLAGFSLALAFVLILLVPERRRRRRRQGITLRPVNTSHKAT